MCGEDSQNAGINRAGDFGRFDADTGRGSLKEAKLSRRIQSRPFWLSVIIMRRTQKLSVCRYELGKSQKLRGDTRN
jgi:hypothetical protein